MSIEAVVISTLNGNFCLVTPLLVGRGGGGGGGGKKARRHKVLQSELCVVLGLHIADGYYWNLTVHTHQTQKAPWQTPDDAKLFSAAALLLAWPRHWQFSFFVLLENEGWQRVNAATPRSLGLSGRGGLQAWAPVPRP